MLNHTPNTNIHKTVYRSSVSVEQEFVFLTGTFSTAFEYFYGAACTCDTEF